MPPRRRRTRCRACTAGRASPFPIIRAALAVPDEDLRHMRTRSAASVNVADVFHDQIGGARRRVWRRPRDPAGSSCRICRWLGSRRRGAKRDEISGLPGDGLLWEARVRPWCLLWRSMSSGRKRKPDESSQMDRDSPPLATFQCVRFAWWPRYASSLRTNCPAHVRTALARQAVRLVPICR